MQVTRVHVVALAVVLLLGTAATAYHVSSTDDGQRDLAFEEVAPEKGIEYVTAGETTGNGDGAVLVADINNDHREDLLLLGGRQPGLYENVGGSFERSDALPTLEADHLKSGLFFDHDNDGWTDLLLLPKQGQPIFLANDEGTFRRHDAGIDANLTWASSAAAADYDGDGCLDLLLTQYGNWTATVPNRGRDRSIQNDNGARNLLYRGTCGEFERVTDAGIEGSHWSTVASFVDLTGDDRPDIHVANDYSHDTLYINQGNGTFARRTLANTNRHGMASDVADVGRDGDYDVFVTNIEYRAPERIWKLRNGLDIKNRGNNLLINQGNGTFEDRAGEYGVRIGGWGWAGTLVDLTNDGHLDLIHTTQDYLALETVSGPGGETERWRQQSDPPALWTGNGSFFERLNGTAAGLQAANGRGLATLDFDADGDQDVIVADTNGRFKLYENRIDGGRWLELSVEGSNGTRLGTDVRVTAGNRTIYKTVSSQTNYFSQNSRLLHVGLGDAKRVDLRVQWPGGTTRTFEGVRTNRRLVVAPNGTLRAVGGTNGSA